VKRLSKVSKTLEQAAHSANQPGNLSVNGFYLSKNEMPFVRIGDFTVKLKTLDRQDFENGLSDIA